MKNQRPFLNEVSPLVNESSLENKEIDVKKDFKLIPVIKEIGKRPFLEQKNKPYT